MKRFITIPLVLSAIIVSLATPAKSVTATNLDEAKTVATTEKKQILIEFYVDD